MAGDLDAYLRRVGHAGPVRADLPTLAALQRAHSAAIPFENLNPWLGLPVVLEPKALQAKLVHGGRGGYCYEHNLLLAQRLREIGFHLTMLAARVVWNASPGSVRPRTHMLLKVVVEGVAYGVDGGFGGMTPTAPLRLDAEGPQPTPLEPYRIVQLDGVRELQAEVGGEWRPLYRFDEQPQHVADYEMASWYLCHHPESQFRQRLLVARTRANGRDVLANNEFTLHRHGQPSRTRVIDSAEELRALLQDVFLLRLPDVPQLQQRLQQAAAARPA